VHWGDCVNTAAKLGDDTAQQEQILITSLVYDAIKDLVSMRGLRFVPHMQLKSGVELHYVELVEPGQEPLFSHDGDSEAAKKTD